MRAITLADLQKAHSVLSKLLPQTPLLRNDWLSTEYGAEVYLKLENNQPIGSFKIRGATYKVSQLTDEEKKRGVIAASAGNHAQGVAWGSKRLGVDAMIVMPVTAPIVKVQNTKALGAQIHLEGEHYQEAYAAAQRIAHESGRVYVHAFDDPDVIAGQGTIGLEILQQLPDADFVIAPIGGGGLAAGLALAFGESKSKIQMIGCQATGCLSMIKSIEQGKAIELDKVETFADGIKVSKATEEIRKILAPRVKLWAHADDEAIAAATLALLEKAKTVAEGAGALPLAVLDQFRDQIKGKKVVLIVGGGNIDVNVLARIIDRGLTRGGRRLRINVLISDKPGSLSRLTGTIAREGANVLQAIHDRNEPSTRIDQTEVELTLETRGLDHSNHLIEVLKKEVLRLKIMV